MTLPARRKLLVMNVQMAVSLLTTIFLVRWLLPEIFNLTKDEGYGKE